MASIRSIIENNNATFYNFRTGARQKIWPRITAFSLFSPLLALALGQNLTDFVNSINTVASILLGFGFSVLFYIASSKDDQISPDASLEKKNRVNRMNTLSKELFHNVSYFVMTASASLAFAMIVIAPEAHSEWFSKEALPYLEKTAPGTGDYLMWGSVAVRSIFFFLLLEAGYTFARVVGRVNFLFEQKLSDGKTNGSEKKSLPRTKKSPVETLQIDDRERNHIEKPNA